MTQTILRDLTDGVLTLTFNRLDKKNALTPSMYAYAAEQIQAAKTDKTVKVLVFQGHESVFTAGNDIVDFNNAPPSVNEDAPVFSFLKAIGTFNKPMLAAVAGPAVGIGTTLLFQCDWAVAGDNATFMMPFVNLGLCPEAGSSYLAPLVMGYQRAAKAFLMCDSLTAAMALDAGLVVDVVPAAQVNTIVQQQAQRLAQKPMTALIETKRLLRLTSQNTIEKHMADEEATFSRMLQGPAAKEAFSAFLEKRKPNFSNL